MRSGSGLPRTGIANPLYGKALTALPHLDQQGENRGVMEASKALATLRLCTIRPLSPSGSPFTTGAEYTVP